MQAIAGPILEVYVNPPETHKSNTAFEAQNKTIIEGRSDPTGILAHRFLTEINFFFFAVLRSSQ